MSLPRGKSPRLALVAGALLAIAASFSGGDPPQPFDKDQFRSRKKWYVTFTLRLHGRGEKRQVDRDDSETVNWNISREVTGTLVYDEVRSGSNSRPKASVLGAGEKSDARFTSWEPSEHGTSVVWTINDEVAHKSVTHGEIHAATEVWGFTKFSGTGTADIHNIDGLSCDMKDMIFDVELEADANDRKQGEPKSLGLVAEYHTFTAGTQVRRDTVYPISRHKMIGLLPRITKSLEEQLCSRKLQLTNDRIGINVLEQVKFLPPFPDSSSKDNSTALNFGGHSTGNGTPLELSLDIIISPTPPTVAKLILKPVGYAQWRPLCSSSEFVKGNDIAVEWRVEEEGGDPARPAKVTRVVFELTETSAEPGVCMNWPQHLTTETPDFDLRFAGAETLVPGYEVREKRQKAVLTDAPAAAGKGTVTVDCFDSGATAVLVAEATLEDGRVVHGRVEGTGAGELPIPDFERGLSFIPRWWREAKAAGKRDDIDDDNYPEGDGQHGDGFTVWEEYRGFWVGGVLDTDCVPLQKDLFICNRIGGKARNGISLFREATKLIVHDELRPAEFRADRVMNFHHAARPHSVDQHGISVQEGGLTAVGKDGKVEQIASICNTDRGASFPGPPKNTLNVSILPSMLDGQEPEWQYSNGERFLVAYADSTVAHELGHGLGIRHHGERERSVTFKFEKLETGELVTTHNGKRVVVRNEKSGDTMTLLNYLTKDRSLRSMDIPVLLGEMGGQMSGDVACFMRYDNAGGYPSLARAGEYYLHMEQEVWGERLCTSPEGTGCNASTHRPQSRYGNAGESRGNCFHKFVVNDKWEKRN
ncbi:MAG: hypothetical protein AAB074_17135 [Planctomycetota bacterium]